MAVLNTAGMVLGFCVHDTLLCAINGFGLGMCFCELSDRLIKKYG